MKKIFNKKIIILVSLIIVSVGIIIFTEHDSFLYSDYIMQITSINETSDGTSEGYVGITEEYFEQNIKGVILNGDLKGQEVNATNTRSTSNVYDENYAVGDKVFVNILNKDNDTVDISNFKRDVYIVALILIFIIAMYIIGQKQGMFTIIALIIDIIIYCFAINLYVSKGIDLILLSAISTVLFTFISLFIATGVNKKSLAAALSTLISVMLMVCIGVGVMYYTKENGIRFDQMNFLMTSYKEAFISELILGGLGAIMDISIILSSTVNELVHKNKNVDNKILFSSCKSIGKDIMGTMLNVLLFTYICTSIPKFVLFFRNGKSVIFIMENYLSIDLARCLVASIGVVLAIPITSFVAVKLIKRGHKS